jgi:hypothetical protein
VSRGVSRIAGWALSPSRIGEYVNAVPGYHHDGPTIRMTVADFVAAIEESLTEAST